MRSNSAAVQTAHARESERVNTCKWLDMHRAAASVHAASLVRKPLLLLLLWAKPRVLLRWPCPATLALLTYLSVSGGPPLVVHPAPRAVSRSKTGPIGRGVLRIVNNVAITPGLGGDTAGSRRGRRSYLDI